MVPKFQLLIQDEILFSDSRSHVISRPSLDAAERTIVRASDDAQLICLEMVRRAGQLGYSFHERTQPFSAASFTSLGVEPCLWGPLAFRGHTFQRSLGRRTTLANELRSHFRSKARVADPSRADAGRCSDRKPCRSRGRNAKCTMIGATLFLPRTARSRGAPPAASLWRQPRPSNAEAPDGNRTGDLSNLHQPAFRRCPLGSNARSHHNGEPRCLTSPIPARPVANRDRN